MSINLPDDYAARVKAVAHIYRVARHSLSTLYRSAIPDVATMISMARRNTGALWRSLGNIGAKGEFSVNYLVDSVLELDSTESIPNLSGYGAGELANMIYVYTRMRESVIALADKHACSDRYEDCDACADLAAAMTMVRGVDRVVAELVEEETRNSNLRFVEPGTHRCKIMSQRTTFGIRWHVTCPRHGVTVGIPYKTHAEALRAALDHAGTYSGMTTC